MDTKIMAYVFNRILYTNINEWTTIACILQADFKDLIMSTRGQIQKKKIGNSNFIQFKHRQN